MNALQKYFAYRQSLINQYIKGDMTKEEYLDANLDAVLSLRDKPFRNVDTVEKGLFNYQYYNAMAKAFRMDAKYAKNNENYLLYEDKINYFYGSKDRSTMRILTLLDYKNVEAYFIKVRSRHLRGRLFEIVLKDYDNMILHSQNDAILNRLKEYGVFGEGSRKSLIDYYINSKY